MQFVPSLRYFKIVKKKPSFCLWKTSLSGSAGKLFESGSTVWRWPARPDDGKELVRPGVSSVGYPARSGGRTTVSAG